MQDNPKPNLFLFLLHCQCQCVQVLITHMLHEFSRLSVHVLLPHAPPDLSTALEHIVLLSKNARGAVLMKGDGKRVIWLSVTVSVSDATACRKHWSSGRPDTVVWNVCWQGRPWLDQSWCWQRWSQHTHTWYITFLTDPSTWLDNNRSCVSLPVFFFS